MPEPLLDIRPDHLQIVRDILQKHVPQYEVWAFGSRAKWTAKEYSDLDLCIKSDKPLSFSVLGAIGDDFSESDLPWKVDVVDWATTSPSFRKIIERDKVVIQNGELGEGMDSEWKTYLFRELCDITRGASPRPIHDYLGGEGMPWIKIADATAESSRFIQSTKERIKLSGVRASVEVFPGDLILSNSATPGLPKFLKINACIHDGWMLLRNFKHLDKDYAYWLLLSERIKLVAQGNGSVFTNLKTDILKNHSVKIPSIETQREIAQSLNAIDDKISLLHEISATLEAIAQALFKSWFVNFDPVRAKAEGIPPEIAALFPSEFEDSVLGEIPKGWQAMPLADACEINPTRRLTKDKQAPYLEMSALPTQGHRTDTPIPRAFSSGTKFINGDTLLARITPCLENGKTAFVDCLLEDEVGWGSTEYVILRPKAPLPSYWAYLLSRHEHFRQYAIQAMVGTSGRQRVDVSRLAQYLVAIPDKRVSVAFAELVEPIQRSIAANDNAAKSLAALRDTMLPRLMSGKLLVPSGTTLEKETA
jgi:type I restriction enzyme, S subunit